MSKRIFSEEQIKELLQNPNVEKCSEKSIGYKKEFKLSASKNIVRACHRHGYLKRPVLTSL